VLHSSWRGRSQTPRRTSGRRRLGVDITMFPQVCVRLTGDKKLRFWCGGYRQVTPRSYKTTLALASFTPRSRSQQPYLQITSKEHFRHIFVELQSKQEVWISLHCLIIVESIQHALQRSTVHMVYRKPSKTPSQCIHARSTFKVLDIPLLSSPMNTKATKKTQYHLHKSHVNPSNKQP
jgi:hypothetical protein